MKMLKSDRFQPQRQAIECEPIKSTDKKEKNFHALDRLNHPCAVRPRFTLVSGGLLTLVRFEDTLSPLK
jgi:hypothetical protein